MCVYICVHIYTFLQILQHTEWSFLGYTVDPCWFSIFTYSSAHMIIPTS